MPRHFTIAVIVRFCTGRPARRNKPPDIPLRPKLGILVRSLLRQGFLSSYRKAYWKFLLRLHAHWLFQPAKLSLGFAMLLSGHHFIRYASTVAAQLEGELNRLSLEKETTEFSNQTDAAEGRRLNAAAESGWDSGGFSA